MLDRLQWRLGYEFSDIELLQQALIHGSYVNEVDDPSVQSNERLEFLGDAVLGAIVAQELFQRFPDNDEGWLTRARVELVRNRTLSLLAASIELGSELQVGKGETSDSARHQSAVLARTLEAVIDAAWLDGGEDAARRIICTLLETKLAELSGEESPSADPKSELQEMTQAHCGLSPTYDVVVASGPRHAPIFRATVLLDQQPLAEGFGGRKRMAERDAASRALEQLRDDQALLESVVG